MTPNNINLMLQQYNNTTMYIIKVTLQHYTANVNHMNYIICVMIVKNIIRLVKENISFELSV